MSCKTWPLGCWLAMAGCANAETVNLGAEEDWCPTRA